MSVILADEQLRRSGAVVNKMSFKNHLPEGTTPGTYGCSGVRWVLEASLVPEAFRKVQITRVFKEGWLITVDEEQQLYWRPFRCGGKAGWVESFRSGAGEGNRTLVTSLED